MAISTANVLELIERQNFRCALTGRLLTTDTASLDHIVPLTQGGKHEISNVQALHRTVMGGRFMAKWSQSVRKQP